MTKRVKQLNIRLSDLELNRLETVSRHLGLSSSEAIRMLLKRAEFELEHEGRLPGQRLLTRSG